MTGNVCRVLVVDDDESVLDSLRLLLESAGYRTAGFGSAEALIEAGLVKNACCLILDIKLPGMSGLELQEYLSSSHTSTPIIIITAHDHPGMEAQALSLGAMAYLRKPFDGQAILDAVQRICTKGGGETTS